MADRALKRFASHTKENTYLDFFPLSVRNSPLHLSLDHMLHKENRDGKAQGRGVNSTELLYSWELHYQRLPLYKDSVLGTMEIILDAKQMMC